MQIQNEEREKKSELNEVTNLMFIKMLYLEQQDSSNLLFQSSVKKDYTNICKRIVDTDDVCESIKSHIHLF